MSTNTLLTIERVCAELVTAELVTAGEPVTFTAVAAQANIGRATLYRNPQLRAIIDDHRTRQIDARTLTSLATEVAHRRTIVETLAATVTNHEEQLRRQNQNPPTRR